MTKRDDIVVDGTRNFYKLYGKLRNPDPIKIELDRTMNLMKGDKINGVYIKKKPWPKIYRNHDVTNLYKYNINSWRLIYTVKGLNRIKHYQILDFLTHKEYNVIFGYD